MNHDTAVWTLLACLLAAAVIGFAVAWTIQFWRVREGSRLAADLEDAHNRLQAAHNHLTVSAEHERAARVQADQRSRDLNDALLTARTALEDATIAHQRQQTRLQEQLARAAEERDHLQQATHQASHETAELGSLHLALRELEQQRDAARTALVAAEEARQQAMHDLALQREATRTALLAADEARQQAMHDLALQREAAHTALAAAEHARTQAELALASAEADLSNTGEQASNVALAAAETRARLSALSAEHAEGQRELLQLRNRLGDASNRTLELEQTINRMQLEALGQAQAHAQALAAAEAAAATPVIADEEDVRIAQRLSTQRVQELEDQLRRTRQLASDYKLEASGLKNRVADLELRMSQLYTDRLTVTNPAEPD